MDLGWYCKAYKGQIYQNAATVFALWDVSGAHIGDTIFKLKKQPLENGFSITNENYLAIDVREPNKVVLSKGIYWYQVTKTGFSELKNTYWEEDDTIVESSFGEIISILAPAPASPTTPANTNGTTQNIFALPKYTEKHIFGEYKIKLRLANDGTINSGKTTESRHVRLTIQKATFAGSIWSFEDVEGAISDYQYLGSQKNELELETHEKEFTFKGLTFEEGVTYVVKINSWKQNIENYFYGLKMLMWKQGDNIPTGGYFDDATGNGDNNNWPFYFSNGDNNFVPVIEINGFYHLE